MSKGKVDRMKKIKEKKEIRRWGSREYGKAMSIFVTLSVLITWALIIINSCLAKSLELRWFVYGFELQTLIIAIINLSITSHNYKYSKQELNKVVENLKMELGYCDDCKECIGVKDESK